MSEIRATTISDETGNGPIALTKQHAAKVWAYWSTGATYDNKGSFNVSSLTDEGTGSTTLNVTNSFNSATNLSLVGICNNYHMLNQLVPTVSTIRYGTYNSSHSAVDAGRNFGIVHGDLA